MSKTESPNKSFLIGLARAAAGAILFSLPLEMTMEMWQLGFAMDPWRLALFSLLSIPLLVGLSHVVGFERTFDWKNDGVDALVALFVAFVSSLVILLLIAVIKPGMALSEIVGKVELQMIPASIGALLAQSELGQDKEEYGCEGDGGTSYFGEIFLMAIGALFLSFSIAPTEEVILIAHRMSSWHALLLLLMSLVLMHGFVYAVEFKGTETKPEGSSVWSVFVKFTVVGYAVAVLMALYGLWTFGRTDGLALEEIAMISIVLGFPASLGAAAARLII